MKEKIVLFYCVYSIICNPGQGFLNILDKSTVEEGEILTMTCDYQRFDFTNETIDSILSITMKRKGVNDSEESEIYSFLPTEQGFEYTKRFPAGRIWDVWASMGGDDFKGQKEKVNLTIAVLDTTMTDSGSYTCDMEYYSFDLLSKTRTEHLTVTKSTYSKPAYTRKNTRTTPAPTRPTTESPVGNQPILDKSTVKEGESFSMTCDYKRFEIVNSGILFDNFVKCVKLSRILDCSLNYSLIYCFCPYDAKCDRTSEIPPGRSWNVHIDHGDHDHYHHQEFVSLRITVNETILADSGSYECDVLFGTDRQYKQNETLRVINGKTRQTKTAGCEDVELTTSKNQKNGADIKDHQHSVLLLLILILILGVTWRM